MSEREKIQKLNRTLQELERRSVANWERPILEIARQAILQEIATVGQQFARWHRTAPSQLLVGRIPAHLRN